MILSNEIRTLRDRVLAELISAHDYYVDTKAAWGLVYGIVDSGRKLTIRNTVTGTVTGETELVVKAYGYMKEQLAEATFQQFISAFENFYFDLLRLWLTAYPQSLGKRMVDFRSVLDLPDKEAITRMVVGRELNEVLYGRPTEWFAYLEDKVKLGCPSAIEIERFAEAKATRDVLVHARGIANQTYESKAGALARFKDGDRIEIPGHYHRETWELIRKLVSEISDAAIARS